MKSDFEERRERRIERYHERSEQAAQEAQSEYEAGHNMAQAIPFGLPILAGHHSEKQDCRYRGCTESHFRASAELHGKSAYNVGLNYFLEGFPTYSDKKGYQHYYNKNAQKVLD